MSTNYTQFKPSILDSWEKINAFMSLKQEKNALIQFVAQEKISPSILKSRSETKDFLNLKQKVNDFIQFFAQKIIFPSLSDATWNNKSITNITKLSEHDLSTLSHEYGLSPEEVKRRCNIVAKQCFKRKDDTSLLATSQNHYH